MGKKILIISHSLNRTGAPLALLQLIKSKPSNLNVKIFLLGLRHSDLENEFKEYVDEMYIVKPNPSKNDFIDLIQRIVAIPEIIRFIVTKKPDIILVNSAANSRALLAAKVLQKFYKFKIVLYLHEFEEMFRAFKFLRLKTILLADKVLVVSLDQFHWLKSKLNFSKDVSVVYNTIDKELVEKYVKCEPEENFLLFKNKNKFLIANIGIMSHRKGIDYFTEIIISLRNYNDIGFVIIGDFANINEKKIFIDNLKKYNMDDKVYITGLQNNIFKYLKYIDVTAITSRSETFSRVALESMVIGVPVVAFNIKGLKNTLPPNYPYLVDNFDINYFCKNILDIKDLPSGKLNLLKEKLMEYSNKYDIKNISNKFWSELLIEELE